VVNSQTHVAALEKCLTQTSYTNIGNSLDKLRHPRSDAYSAEQVLRISNISRVAELIQTVAQTSNKVTIYSQFKTLKTNYASVLAVYVYRPVDRASVNPPHRGPRQGVRDGLWTRYRTVLTSARPGTARHSHRRERHEQCTTGADCTAADYPKAEHPPLTVQSKRTRSILR